MVWEWEAQMYRIWMKFPDGTESVYGTYANKHQANEIAMQIRDERGCEVEIEVMRI